MPIDQMLWWGYTNNSASNFLNQYSASLGIPTLIADDEKQWWLDIVGIWSLLIFQSLAMNPPSSANPLKVDFCTINTNCQQDVCVKNVLRCEIDEFLRLSINQQKPFWGLLSWCLTHPMPKVKLLQVIHTCFRRMNNVRSPAEQARSAYWFRKAYRVESIIRHIRSMPGYLM